MHSTYIRALSTIHVLLYYKFYSSDGILEKSPCRRFTESEDTEHWPSVLRCKKAVIEFSELQSTP